MDWPHTTAAVSAAFLGSLVEFVEALTIILAVGITRGWQAAWAGTIAGLAVLIVVVAALGPALLAIPIEVLQLVVGVLLLLFGMRWLRKTASTMNATSIPSSTTALKAVANPNGSTPTPRATRALDRMRASSAKAASSSCRAIG